MKYAILAVLFVAESASGGLLAELRAAHCATCQDMGLTVGQTARRLGDDPKTILAHYDRRQKGEGESVRLKLNGGQGRIEGALDREVV